MARLDWDRLRRNRPLDGADARVDPDGGVIWKQPDEASAPFGAERLRFGVIVRRLQATSNEAERGLHAKPHRCARCGERIPPRKVLRHALRCAKSTS